jgi:adenosylcobinamide-GDP ribazoletransferase
MIWEGLRTAVTLLTAIPLRARQESGGARPDAPPDEPPHPGGDGDGDGQAGSGAAAPTAPQAATVTLETITRPAAEAAMTWAPLVGLVLGGVAALVLTGADRLLHTGPLVGSALAVATLAAATRGLHLDGLADLADGLGSGKPAAQALDIMKRSDIGPFGTITLVLILLIQVASLTQARAAGHGPAAVIVAAVTGRLALTWACRRGVPAAREEGLGALVAGTVRPVVPLALTVVALGISVAFGWILFAAIAVGIAASLALSWYAVRRLGGITGDVLGAVMEVTTAACLVVTAMS